MYDDSFEKFRGECLEQSHNRNKQLIEDWCKKSKMTHPVGFYNDLSNHIMTIYTDRPGWLIGKAGIRFDEFKAALREEFGRDYEVKFVEIRGGIVNINCE